MSTWPRRSNRSTGCLPESGRGLPCRCGAIRCSLMDLLERLVQTPAVSGREHRLRELIRRETQDLFDEVSVDAMGSLIGVRRPRPAGGKDSPASARPLKVMLAAHMDQIGFLVRHIDDKGFLRINPVGGFDPRNLFARLCVVCPNLADPSQDL